MEQISWLATTSLPTRYGTFMMSVYQGDFIHWQVSAGFGSHDTTETTSVRRKRT